MNISRVLIIFHIANFKCIFWPFVVLALWGLSFVAPHLFVDIGTDLFIDFSVVELTGKCEEFPARVRCASGTPSASIHSLLYSQLLSTATSTYLPFCHLPHVTGKRELPSCGSGTLKAQALLGSGQVTGKRYVEIVQDSACFLQQAVSGGEGIVQVETHL